MTRTNTLQITFVGLMKENFLKLTASIKSRSAIPVFWTIEDFHNSQNESPDGSNPNGIGFTGLGMVLSRSVESPRAANVLAHELGHYAGYVGNAPGNHSSDSKNVMHASEVGTDPDPEYCK